MRIKKISLPISDEDIKRLTAGEEILLSGTLYTARDAVHKLLTEAIRDKQILPISLRGITIYYAGPAPARPPRVIGSCGPTTSARMDFLTPVILKAGVKAMIGKGRRSETVKEAIKQYGAVYFVAPAGCGALLANKIKRAKAIAYKELGPEAIYELEVEDFPVIVGIDANGNDIYNKTV